MYCMKYVYVIIQIGSFISIDHSEADLKILCKCKRGFSLARIIDHSLFLCVFVIKKMKKA